MGSRWCSQLGIEAFTDLTPRRDRDAKLVRVANHQTDEGSQSFLARNFRAPLASAHPYLPENTPVMTYNLTGKNIVDKVPSYCGSHIDAD